MFESFPKQQWAWEYSKSNFAKRIQRSSKNKWKIVLSNQTHGIRHESTNFVICSPGQLEHWPQWVISSEHCSFQVLGNHTPWKQNIYLWKRMVPERRTSLKQGPWRVKDQPLKTQTEPQNHKSNSCQIRSSGKKKSCGFLQHMQL